MQQLHLTDHARSRSQQRAIPEVVLDGLLSYGKAVHDHRGSLIVFFDHQAKNRLRREWGEREFRHYEAKLDAYAVLAPDGSVVTVGHRTRRIPRH
jgi:hypothetical protein